MSSTVARRSLADLVEQRARPLRELITAALPTSRVALLVERPDASGSERPVVVPTIELRWSFAPVACAFHRRTSSAFCRLRTQVTLQLSGVEGSPVRFVRDSDARGVSDEALAHTRELGEVHRDDFDAQLRAIFAALTDWTRGA